MKIANLSQMGHLVFDAHGRRPTPWIDVEEDDLVLRPSPLLTDENVDRLREASQYAIQTFLGIIRRPASFYEFVKGYQNLLGEELIAELRLGRFFMRVGTALRDWETYVPSYAFIGSLNEITNHRIGSVQVEKGFLYRVYEEAALNAGHTMFGRDTTWNIYTNALHNFLFLRRNGLSVRASLLYGVELARGDEQQDASSDAAVNALLAATMVVAEFTGKDITDRDLRNEESLQLEPLKGMAPAKSPVVERVRTALLAKHGGYYCCPENLLEALLNVIVPETDEYLSEEDVKLDCTPVLMEMQPTFVEVQEKTECLPKKVSRMVLGSANLSIPFLHGRNAYGLPVVLFPATTACLNFLCRLYGLKVPDNITPLTQQDACLFQALTRDPMQFAYLAGRHPASSAALFRSMTPKDFRKYFSLSASTALHDMDLLYTGDHSLTGYMPGMAYSDDPVLRVHEYVCPVVVTTRSN